MLSHGYRIVMVLVVIYLQYFKTIKYSEQFKALQLCDNVLYKLMFFFFINIIGKIAYWRTIDGNYNNFTVLKRVNLCFYVSSFITHRRQTYQCWGDEQAAARRLHSWHLCRTWKRQSIVDCWIRHKTPWRSSDGHASGHNSCRSCSDVNEAAQSADTRDTSETRQAAAAADNVDGSCLGIHWREARCRVCRKLALFARQSPVTESARTAESVKNRNVLIRLSKNETEILIMHHHVIVTHNHHHQWHLYSKIQRIHTSINFKWVIWHCRLYK